MDIPVEVLVAPSDERNREASNPDPDAFDAILLKIQDAWGTNDGTLDAKVLAKLLAAGITRVVIPEAPYRPQLVLQWTSQ